MTTEQPNATLAALRKASQGLVYTSETDAPLEAFLWEDSGKLTKKHLLELTGGKRGARVERETLEDFLYAVPEEDRPAFDKLAQTLKQQLSDVKVYKVGSEPEKQVYVVGKSRDGHWAGLKTMVVET